MYQPKKNATALEYDIRGLKHTVYRWGPENGAPIVLLHGWADTGISFQFVADAMDERWTLYAPDLRGFGKTQWNPQGYWFADYFADVDALLQEISPDQPVPLVGHSMGGNVSSLYAGIVPERVSHMCTIDQVGLPDRDPADAPGNYANWIEQWREPPTTSVHPTTEIQQRRIQQTAPHMPAERAEWLVQHWVKKTSGGYTSVIDPAHKRPNPVLYRRSEAVACWKRVTVPSLLAIGRESIVHDAYINKGLAEDFRDSIANLREEVIADSGHMVHLDQPEKLAALLQDFLSST